MRIMDDQQIIPGDEIVLVDSSGRRGDFTVNVGDALLKGNQQIWLCDDNSPEKKYVRKQPEGAMSIGVAIFSSLEELSSTIASGEYYID